jgi:hypothetical protein
MNDASVQEEVHSRQRIPHEEIVRQHITFQSVARAAGGDEVAVRGDTSPRARVHVIESRMIMLEPGAAVHAAPAAVAHYGALERSLEIDVAKVGRTTPPEESARRAGEADAMNAVPRHCTSPKWTTPRAGWGTRAGRRVVVSGVHQREATTVGRRCSGSEEGRRSTLMCLQSLIGRGSPLGRPRALRMRSGTSGRKGAARPPFIISTVTPRKRSRNGRRLPRGRTRACRVS